MSPVPSWVVPVAIILGLLSWSVSSVIPNVDPDVVSLVTFLLGMAVGGVAVPVWLSWHWQRKARR